MSPSPEHFRALFVAWQEPESRRYHVVGRLTRGTVLDYPELYEFVYTRGALEAADGGFEPLLAFPSPATGLNRFGGVFRSLALFPFFANRIMSPRRPDYEAYIASLGLTREEAADPMTQLARSGGARATDPFELFPMPEIREESDGVCYEFLFFVHGFRHLTPEEQHRVLQLRVGDELCCHPEPENPVDPAAILVLTVDGVRAGWIPRYLAPDVGDLCEACDYVTAQVAQVNPSAATPQRLLCRLTTCVPVGAVPFVSEPFEPIPAEAARLGVQDLEFVA